MQFFRRRKGLLVGLDIGSNSVKAVQLVERGGRYSVETLGLIPLAPEVIVEGQIIDPPAVADSIQKLFEQAQIKTQRVAFAASGSAVFVKRVSVPATPDPAELHESILWETEQYLPFSREEVLIDYHILQEESTETQVEAVIVALKRDYAQMYIDIIQQANLEPAVFDIDAFAIQNAFEVNYPELAQTRDVVALIHVGASKLTMNIVRGMDPLFVRDAMMGMRALTEIIRTEFNLTYDQAELAKRGRYEIRLEQLRPYMQQVFQDIAREIAKTIRFFRQNFTELTIRQAFLSGGGVLTPGFREFTQHAIELPVEILDPFRTIDASNVDPDFIEEHRPILAVAVGLALRRG